MKNKYLIWIVPIICFLTYYLPSEYFPFYEYTYPIWLVILFIATPQLSFWINWLMWRVSPIGTDEYNMFHHFHFKDKEWKNKKSNLNYIEIISQISIISMLILLLSSQFISVIVYEIIITLLWVWIIPSYKINKNEI